MRIELEEFFNDFKKSKSLKERYNDISYHEMKFVRKHIVKELFRNECYVVSTYKDGRYEYPVYEFKNENMTIYLKSKLYAWIISVDSKIPIKIDKKLTYHFKDEPNVRPEDIDGFNPEWLFPDYQEGCLKFTNMIVNQFCLWTLIYQLMKYYDEQK